MKFNLNLILMLLCSFTTFLTSQNIKNEQGYKFFIAHNYIKAIETLEKRIDNSDKTFAAQAMLIIINSHIELAKLYKTAGYINAEVTKHYLTLLNEDKNFSGIDYINFFLGSNYLELGDEANSKSYLQRCLKTKLPDNYKKIANEFINVGYKNTNIRETDFKKLAEPMYVDRSKRDREIKFYNNFIFKKLHIYHLNEAKKKIKELESYNSSKLLDLLNEYSTEISYELGDYNAAIESGLLNKTQKNLVYLGLSFYKLNKKVESEKYFEQIRDVEKISTAGYLYSEAGDISKGNSIAINAYKKKQSAETALNLGLTYLYIKNYNSAKEMFDKIYSHSKIYDYSENKPLYALLYSYTLYHEGIGIYCPSVIQIADLLGKTFPVFYQYHNSLQGICTILSTKHGPGQLK
jgi:hypothetical protein